MLIFTPGNSFRKHEISISRIFWPINFDAARSKGSILANIVTRAPGNFSAIPVCSGELTFTPITGDRPRRTAVGGERIILPLISAHRHSTDFYHNQCGDLGGKPMPTAVGDRRTRSAPAEHLRADLARTDVWKTATLLILSSMSPRQQQHLQNRQREEEIPIQ